MTAAEPNEGRAGPITGEAEAARLRGEHEAALQALQRAVRDSTRLSRMLAVLTEKGAREHVFDRVLATLSELFLADVVILLETTADGGVAPLASIGVPEHAGPGLRSGPVCRRIAAVLEGHAPVIADSLHGAAGTGAELAALGAETAAWLPVIGDGAIRGVLVLARCRPLPFASDEAGLLSAIAYRLGQMLDRAREEQERQQLETRLRQAQKAESLGRMAGAIAHHFNNMLGVVQGGIDLALRELPATSPGRAELDEALVATHRAADISGLMLAYLGQGAGRRVPLDLVKLVQESLRGLKRPMPVHIRLTTLFPRTGPVVAADAGRLRQLVANLVENAWEAIGPAAGEIRVAVRVAAVETVPRAHAAITHWEPKAPEYACLEVSDDGVGMDAATLERIFDPFFTTKTGRGLGLPVVLGTIRAHEGAVAVRSVEGSGTAFQVYLPVTHEAAAASPEATLAPPPAGAGRLVLVADDEEFVRTMTKRMLVRLGYDVVLACDGIDAVEKFRAQPADFRFVLLDLTMPGLDGWGALTAMRVVRRNVPVILASGYDGAHVMDRAREELPQVFLHKPYLVDDLKSAIDRIWGEG